VGRTGDSLIEIWQAKRRGALPDCAPLLRSRRSSGSGDPVLERVAADRRETLLVERTDDGYRFDIRIPGEHETVLFDVPGHPRHGDDADGGGAAAMRAGVGDAPDLGASSRLIDLALEGRGR
jgi:hypothetical protein